MSNWYDSKNQLSTGSITAFGIELCTRYNLAREMVEMINFATLVAEAGLEAHVGKVFYDSKSCCATFELRFLEPHDDTDKQLLSIAQKTIGQFEWNGIVDHGRLTS